MSVTTIDRPAERPDWLALRHKYANASDAAAYVGKHPFKTLADIAVEKLSAEPPAEIVGNRAIDRGNRLEPVVADWWAEEHGVSIYEPKVLYVCGRMMATLDRAIVGNDTDALEIKTTAKETDGVLDYWWWQAQAQMLCADRQRIHFAVLDASMDLCSYTVERDDEAIAALVAAVEQAWEFLSIGMVPEGVELTYDHVKALHPEAEEKAVPVADEEFSVVVRWAQLRAERLAIEKAEDAAKAEVARLFGDAAVLVYDDKPIATWKNPKPSDTFDKAAFEADYPDLVAKYTVKKPGARRLLPTKALNIEEAA